jgi:cytochrome P450
MIERSEHDWDPRDPSVLGDQRRAYDEMRARCPVAHSDFLGWSLFTQRDVVEAVRDTATFSSATRRRAIPNGMDPPEHTAFRHLLDPFFTPDRMAAFEPRSREIASALLGPIVARGEAEFIGEFAAPFAHQAVCAFAGWPVVDWNRVRGWTHGNQEAAFRQDREAGAAVAREFSSYVTGILGARHTADAPAADLIGRLLMTSVGGRPLNDEDIVSVLRTWTAGHGTVASAIGIVVLHLACDPDLQGRLRREPVLIDRAIREILRADGPLVSNNRTTTRDVTVGGRAISSGQRVALMWIAANRDPGIVPDPDRIRLDRGDEDDLVFGAGIHRCLGEPLAMLEIRVALEELLGATSRMELTSGQGEPREVYPANGMRSLSISLTPWRLNERP